MFFASNILGLLKKFDFQKEKSDMKLFKSEILIIEMDGEGISLAKKQIVFHLYILHEIRFTNMAFFPIRPI